MHTLIFANNGGHHIGYAINFLQSPWIIHDASPIIVDTPLTFIFRRW